MKACAAIENQTATYEGSEESPRLYYPACNETRGRRIWVWRIHEMTKHLLVLFFCLFLVMIGFGITLPIFAFYAERLAKAGGASQGAAAVHVGLLTGIYAFMQFLFAPLWGRWSDRIGRKPLVLTRISHQLLAKGRHSWHN
ncbi:MAG: MFS transporter [Acidobacteriota bacterium]|nr:MFS transporter [Acidobacteriota bacterium]